MIYFCDGERIDITDGSFKLLNKYETLEGMSYEKNGLVYKIYYDDEEYFKEIGDTISEEECKILTTIETEHFFLPKGIIYDENGKYAGCKSIFIPPLAIGTKRIVERPIEDFFDNLEEIKNDLKILAQNGVLIFDVGTNNMIDNGRINIFDAGSYTVDPTVSSLKIANNHYNEFNDLIGQIVSDEIKNASYNTRDYQEAIDYFLGIAKRSNGIIKLLEKEAKNYASVCDFAQDIYKMKRLKR